jgi:hypothetical protein
MAAPRNVERPSRFKGQAHQWPPGDLGREAGPAINFIARKWLTPAEIEAQTLARLSAVGSDLKSLTGGVFPARALTWKV